MKTLLMMATLATLSLIACASQPSIGATEAPAKSAPAPTATPEPTVNAPAHPTDCEKAGAFQPDRPIALSKLPAAPGKKFCPIIMSILPEIVEWLEQGVKHYEYRKVFPTVPITHIVYYNTGTHEIVGYAAVGETLVGKPSEITDMTWKQSGATREDLMDYFGETREFGYATALKPYVKFAKPITLHDAETLDKDFFAPPKYVFVSRFPNLEKVLKHRMKAAK